MRAELSLLEIAPGGDGMGRLSDGLVVFVPGGTVGDRVEVELLPVRKGHARARLLRLLTSSPTRVAPPCPLASPDRCGGCPLMASDRPSQLAAKESWVRRALRKLPTELRPILAPTPELGYRLRARAVVRDGRLGFASDASTRGVAILSCPVLEPALDWVLFGHCAKRAATFGEGATVQGLCGQLAGRTAVQLAVELHDGRRRVAVRALLAELVASGTISGAELAVAGRGQPPPESLGATSLELGSDSEWGPFLGSAAGFAQSSAAGHSLLPRLVTAALCEPSSDESWPPKHPLRLLELYAGSGNLSRALEQLPGLGRLVTVEGEQAAVERSRSRRREPPPAISPTLVARPVEESLAAYAATADGPQFDAVILDPPRTGARAALAGLAAVAAQRIIYVSCDPMTLARDLGELAALGYRALSVQPVDLMPHTAHVECVALLERLPLN